MLSISSDTFSTEKPGMIDLRERASSIRLVCADFDGVFTDGMVYVNQDGVETVRCSRRDSLGVNMLQRAGIAMHVISKETNPVVEARCRKMGVACDYGVNSSEDKLAIMMRAADHTNLDLVQVCFIGDDVNDRAALRASGLAATVADAHPSVKEIAHFITTARGGEHAVRELCEFILTAKGIEIEY